MSYAADAWQSKRDRSQGRTGLRPGHVVVALVLGLALIAGMGLTESYVMAPCSDSPVFGMAGDHGRAFCYVLKGSMLAPALAGELVMLCVLLFLLASSRARLDDLILGTAAGRRAAGLGGIAILLAVNTPIATSTMVLVGCPVQQPRAAEGAYASGPSGWCHIPLGAHPILFEKESKKTHGDYFDLRAVEGLQRMIA